MYCNKKFQRKSLIPPKLRISKNGWLLQPAKNQKMYFPTHWKENSSFLISKGTKNCDTYHFSLTMVLSVPLKLSPSLPLFYRKGSLSFMLSHKEVKTNRKKQCISNKGNDNGWIREQRRRNCQPDIFSFSLFLSKKNRKINDIPSWVAINFQGRCLCG